MSKFQKYSKACNKLKRKLISFLRDSNPTYLNTLYILTAFIPIFLLSFQNCKKTDVDTSLGNSSPAEVTYEKGQIIEIDTTTDEAKEDRLLPSESDIKLQFLNADPVSDNYKWSIQRGFDSIVTDAPTTAETYQTKFSSGLGAYDVSANAYQSTTLKTSASKRFVVGGSCSLNDILEIELSSDSAASLKAGASDAITFALKDSANFSSIQWKATLPSGETTTNETDVDTLEVDLSSESPGTLLIEVSAVSSDTTKAGCLTYRKKEVTVTSNVTPYFNPLDFTDGTNNILIILENNDIYRYERSEITRFVQIEVLNADTCQYQANSGSKVNFSCDGELIRIPASSDTDCIEGTVTLFASNSQGQSASQSYYYYCEEDGDYCYFGPTDKRLGSHVCPITQSSQRDIQSQKRMDFEIDPSVTTTTSSPSCPNGQCCPECTDGKQCSNGQCVTPDPCAGVTCTNGKQCSNGSCVCPTGQCCPGCTSGKQCKSGQCVTPDPCAGVTCTNGKQCSNGSCVCPAGQCCPGCTSGKQCKSGQCVTPDPCAGVTCTNGKQCSNGSCVCPAGQCCPGCTSGKQCKSGQCVTPDPCTGVTCTGGKQCSNGQCVTPDPCAGVTCTNGKQCGNGSCVCPTGQCCPGCTGGKQCKSGQCVTPDPCAGVTCTGGKQCSNGSCVCPTGQCCPGCTGGKQCSNGQCVTPNPCAGVTCTSGKQCSNGSCVCPTGQCCPGCTGGQQCSNGRCVTPNPCTGVTCTNGKQCSNGSCVCPTGQILCLSLTVEKIKLSNFNYLKLYWNFVPLHFHFVVEI